MARPRKKKKRSQSVLDPSNPLSRFVPQDIIALANQLAAAGLRPERQAVRAEREAAARRTAGQAETLKGFNLAAADVLKDLAPQGQAAFSGAAGNISTYAKGFSQGFQEESQRLSGQSNELLAQQGSPQQVTPSNAADTIFGLGGFLPAQSFEQQGAAFSSFLSALPAVQTRTGQQGVERSLFEGEEQQRAFAQQLIDLAKQVPGRRAEALQQLIGLGIQAEASQRASESLALDERSTVAGITGVDPATGQPTFEAKKESWEQALDLAEVTGVFTDPRTGRKYRLPEGSGIGAYSASLSEQLGYLVDSKGVPFRDNKGRAIPWKGEAGLSKRGKLANAKEAAVNMAKSLANVAFPGSGESSPGREYFQALLRLRRAFQPDLQRKGLKFGTIDRMLDEALVLAGWSKASGRPSAVPGGSEPQPISESVSDNKNDGFAYDKFGNRVLDENGNPKTWKKKEDEEDDLSKFRPGPGD
jgi:hypothetical protein